MDDDDNPVAVFMSVTGTDYEVALEFLEKANFNLQDAIEKFMSGGGGDFGGGGDTAEDDAALAARLHQEQQEEATRRAAAADNVREVIPQFQDTLVGDGYDHGANNFAVRRHEHQAHQSAFLSNISRDFRREAESAENVEKSMRLAELYKPPLDIMFRGSFEEAKHEAGERQKWLLVNLQKEDEFQCHMLNRDVFKKEALKQVISASFIFWQMEVNSSQGMQYKVYYKVGRFPHIGIIDPMTGQCMKKWEGQECLDADLAEGLVEFLDRPQGRPAKKQFVKPPSEEPAPRRPRAMTEEEELEAAIAASLGQPAPRSREASPPSPPSRQAAPAPQEAPARKPSLAAYVLPEPAAGHPQATRLQFRMPDGGQVVRGMTKDMKTKDVYAFLRFTVEEATEGRLFDAVMFPNTVLPEDNTTLEACGAVNAVVVMRWKSEED